MKYYSIWGRMSKEDGWYLVSKNIPAPYLDIHIHRLALSWRYLDTREEGV